MGNKFIRNYIAKRVAGRSDDGIMITLSDPKKIDFQVAMMEDLLMRNGIDPRAITSENQFKGILNLLESVEKANLAQNIKSGITSSKSARIFDLEGKEIPRGSKIMGGKEVKGTSDRDRVRNEMKEKYGFTDERLDEIENTPVDEEMADRLIAETDLPPPGSRGGDEDIAAPVQSQEETLRNMTEAEIKANLEAQNKSAVKKILERKNREDVYGLEDYDTTNMSEIKKEIIRTETKLGNLNPTNPGFRERANVLINKIEDLKKKLKRDKTPSTLDQEIKNAYDKAVKEGKFKGTEEDFRNKIDNMRDEDLATGGRVGYFMGSPNPAGTATIREMLKFFSKGSSTGKTGSEMLQLTNPKSLNKLLMDPNIYRKFDIKKGIAAPELIKSMQSQMTSERKKMLEEILGAAKNIQKSDESTIKYKNEMIDEMIAKGVDRNMAEDMAGMLSKMAENVAGKRDTPKLSKEGILQLETILKNMETGNKPNRKLNADGGRIGFKDGPGMTRRTFLKILGGAVSIPIIGKFFKPVKVGKTVKKLPVIQTEDVAGKPEWFDQLVNKVILEGDDVTKNFATKDREIVHTKKLNDTDEVTVYRDLETDSVRVEYKSPDNMLEEQVDLSYKRTPPDEGAPRGSAEFEATEMGYVGRADGPDDYFIDAEEVGGRSIKALDSDVSALKEYATGQKPTMKEIVQKMKRKEKVKKLNEGDLEAQSQYVTDRQGDYYDYDDYASGGIARMLGE